MANQEQPVLTGEPLVFRAEYIFEHALVLATHNGIPLRNAVIDLLDGINYLNDCLLQQQKY